MSYTILLFLLVISKTAVSDITPTSPGPGDVFASGSPCIIKWDIDTSGLWKNISISLMSGSNSAMEKLATVASGVDGTDATLLPYSRWTCPPVYPNSAIYFYQFINNNDNNTLRWTTRFTIASSNGTIPPDHSSQDGQSIPWGSGSLVPGNSTNTTSQLSSATTSPVMTPSISGIPSSKLYTSRSTTSKSWADNDALEPLTLSPGQQQAASSRQVSFSPTMSASRSTSWGIRQHTVNYSPYGAFFVVFPLMMQV